MSLNQRSELATMDNAEFVKSARARLNLTQIALAEALGFERRSIIRYEQGEELPRVVKLAIDALLNQHREKLKRRRKAKAATGQQTEGDAR